jgi:hypothetical protein
MKTFRVFGIMFLVLIAAVMVFGIAGAMALDKSAGPIAASALPFPAFAFAGIVFGRKIFDFGAIEKFATNEEKKKAIIKRASNFMKELLDDPLIYHKEKLAGVDSTLQGTTPVASVYTSSIKTPDRGYEVLFDEYDMRASSNDSFEILDITGGVTFYQVKPGEEVKLSAIPKGALTNVKYLQFAGGINILDVWLRFNQYYKIEELFSDVVLSWWDKKADLFYGLLEALGAGINQAYDTSDVKTINNACANILIDCKAAGLKVPENPDFVITCNPLLKDRILTALKMTYETQGVNKQVVFNVPTVVTTSKVLNTRYYVSLPGFKNKRGEWEDLNAREAQRDEQHLGAVHVWTGMYNGVIGQSAQHKRCALS